jgi:hypothetical protein
MQKGAKRPTQLTRYDKKEVNKLEILMNEG